MIERKKPIVFDCVLYDGELDVLNIRLHELASVVDTFVIIEGTLTFSGQPREIAFDPGHPSIAPFAGRCRHVVVDDFPATDSAWDRECWQRNAIVRGIPDAETDDVVIMADVDEIPRAEVIVRIIADREHRHFGLKLAFFYFFVDWRNKAGPEAASVWAVVARRSELDAMTPDGLRRGIREHRFATCLVDDAGWHFSYLMDVSRLHRKIKAFSHQEYNHPDFLDNVDINALVESGGDLFGRPGYVWARGDVAQLPIWLRDNRRCLKHLFLPMPWYERLSALLRPRRIYPAARAPASPPVVICPYIYERELKELQDKFAPRRDGEPKIDFCFCWDEKRIGPERAMQRCWERFPDRDIIIIHTDMAPWPGDPPTLWYETLCTYRTELPQAAMLALNLYYPPRASEQPTLQHGGGIYRRGVVDYLRSELHNEPGDRATEDLGSKRVRQVDWVNFGGVLIRRNVIAACGGLDTRYIWAYMMDVDYCLQARLHGFRLYQVPGRLQHEESRTTRKLWTEQPELRRQIDDNRRKFKEKWDPFEAALPSVVVEPHPIDAS